MPAVNPDPNARREAAWKSWLAQLTSSAQRAALRAENALPADTRPTLDSLELDKAADADKHTSAVAAYFEKLSPEPEEEIPLPPDKVNYFLVESPEGEYPTLRAFRGPKALAARLGSLEGRNIIAWAFYGTHLPLTKGKQRYLLLPDGVGAIQVPIYAGGPAAIVDASLLEDLEMQSDGYLGDPAMFNEQAALAPPQSFKTVTPVSVKTIPSRDEDDEDDEDDDDDDDEPPPKRRPVKPRK